MAVGLLTMRFRPEAAICPASLGPDRRVVARAGKTVMTVFGGRPSPQVGLGVPLQLGGHARRFPARCTCRRSRGSSRCLHVALTKEMVRSTLVTASDAGDLANQPGPVILEARRTEGVVRAPSGRSDDSGPSPPSRTVIAELVVPRSIPTARAMVVGSFRPLGRPRFGSGLALVCVVHVVLGFLTHLSLMYFQL